MIVTVTLNPTIDKTIVVESFNFSKMSRGFATFIEPSGKGIDVSRIAKILGEENIATGFIGMKNGKYILNFLKKKKIKVNFVKIRGETRYVYIVLDSSTKIHSSISEPSFYVPKNKIEELKNKLKNLSKKYKIIVIAGSLPRGVDENIYYQLTKISQKNGAKILIDTEGKPLKISLKANPYLVKINKNEAEELVNKKLRNLGEIIECSKKIQGEGAKNVIITLGKYGLVALTEDGILYRGIPPSVKPVNSTGCGDALLAGIAVALSRKKNFEEALKLGIASATAVLIREGTANCRKKDVEKFYKKAIVKKIKS
jgi:1-phosphofructokinase family hexose kinase